MHKGDIVGTSEIVRIEYTKVGRCMCVFVCVGGVGGGSIGLMNISFIVNELVNKMFYSHFC